MNIFERDKTQKIQDYLVELYSLKLQDGEFNAEARKMFAEKSFANWVSSLQGYSEEQIKEAINWYHKNKNNRTAPKLAQILATLEYKARKDVGVSVDVSKPVCPIKEWQEDFDTVLRQACMDRITYNPYWSEQDVVKDNFKGAYLRNPDGSLSTKTFKIHWKECLEKAKKEATSEFSSISRFDNLMLEFTLAYRLGYLEF